MRKYKFSHLFKKNVKKLKGQELQNILNKKEEILTCENITHYKNLSHDLKKFRRVHVNNSYVILFFGDNDIVYFVDYAHHNIIYKHSKKDLKKYNNLNF